jgi:hypothetical protein
MEFVIVPLVGLFASGLTMFSGFGLGTLLLPVFALFLPIELAIAATALVHGATNVLKVGLLGRQADLKLVVRFGVPAIAAAFAGVYVLVPLSGMPELVAYSLLGKQAIVTPLKLAMAVLMAAFALLELHPRFEKLEIDRRYLPLGGVLSGFFGGLSGHQARCGRPSWPRSASRPRRSSAPTRSSGSWWISCGSLPTAPYCSARASPT